MEQYKSGFIAVIGRPNVGKSTLLNGLIGQKIAIMSDKPQTTRTRIVAVYTDETMQAVFLDTPGIHRPIDKLGEHMLKAVRHTLEEVDAIFFVVDAAEKQGAGERYIMSRLESAKCPVLLVVNKTDLVDNDALLPIIASYAEKFDFAAVVPVSAKEKTNFAALMTEAKKYLPAGPKYYPDDMVTDQPERLVMAELIREKVLLLTHDEVPHSIAVDTDEITKRRRSTLVRATIYTERDSQKGIIIGKNGALLKEIGRAARDDIEKLLGEKIYLDLWVKVKKDWRKKDGAIRGFGLDAS